MGIEGVIRKYYPRALLLLSGLGIPFLIIHKSSKPIIGPYSIEFIILILIPLVVITSITMLISLKLVSFDWLRKLINPIIRLEFQGILLTGLIIITSAIYSLVPIDYMGTLLLFVSVGFLFLLGGRIWRSVNPLLTGGLVVSFGLVLFGIEVANLVLMSGLKDEKGDINQTDKLVWWGDGITFPVFFQKSGSYIGSGGRLRPNLNVKMVSPNNQNGVSLVTNNIGLRNDVNFKNKSQPGVLRILSLGDSFSTGFSVGQEYFFGEKLKSILTKTMFPRKVEVLNAEISDPAYGAWFLKTYGIALNPDIVLFGLSINDIMQSEQFFGFDKLFVLDNNKNLIINENFNNQNISGFDRFNEFKYSKKGNKHYFESEILNNWGSRISRFKLFKGMKGIILGIYKNKNQLDIWNYSDSYERLDGHKRLIDGSCNLGFFYNVESEVIEKMYQAFFPLLTYMSELAEANGARFILFIHPNRYQVQPQDWQAMSKLWNFDNIDFDLRLRNKRVVNFCENEGIRVIDPVEIFANDSRQLYLSKDVHYNDVGHQIAAKEVAKYIDHLFK
jgi:hypothetical protein